MPVENTLGETRNNAIRYMEDTSRYSPGHCNHRDDVFQGGASAPGFLPVANRHDLDETSYCETVGGQM